MKTLSQSMIKRLASGAVLTFALGCIVAQPVMAKAEDVEVERIASSYAHISHATISPTDSGLEVRGTVHKRWHTRGRVRGHVNIEVVAPDGSLLFEESVRHSRRSSKQQGARFFAKIPVEVSAGSKVRIVHHDVPILD